MSLRHPAAARSPKMVNRAVSAALLRNRGPGRHPRGRTITLHGILVPELAVGAFRQINPPHDSAAQFPDQAVGTNLRSGRETVARPAPVARPRARPPQTRESPILREQQVQQTPAAPHPCRMPRAEGPAARRRRKISGGVKQVLYPDGIAGRQCGPIVAAGSACGQLNTAIERPRGG